MIYTDLGTCLRRESDGACIPNDINNADYARAVAQFADGTAQLVPASRVDPIPARIAAAWAAANTLAESAIDHNSREQFIVWLIDPASSPTRKQAIGECLSWMGQVWGAYAATKAQIASGKDVAFDCNTPCPYTFWDVAAL